MRNVYELRIIGKDIKRFVRNLYKSHIQFLKLEYDKNSCILQVSEEDYLKIRKIKTIYEIEVLDTFGIPKLKWLLQKYKIFLGSILVGIFLLYFMTHIILDIEVVHNKKEIRDLIIEELKKKGMTKYHFVKSFDMQEKIVSDLLREHRNEIEWLEIERVGTKYIVKVEERILNEKLPTKNPRNVVAKKAGIVSEIIAENGEVLTKVNNYVKAGDVLISGVIKNNEEVMGNIVANGKIFAETWYNVTVELPTFYKDEKKTGRKKNVLSIQFLNRKWNIFDFSPYSSKKTIEKISFSNPLLPLKLYYGKEEELMIEEELYSRDQAILKAYQVAEDQLKLSLGKEDEIFYRKSLKITEEDSKIIVVIFFKVKEDITAHQEIVEMEQPKTE